MPVFGSASKYIKVVHLFAVSFGEGSTSGGKGPRPDPSPHISSRCALGKNEINQGIPTRLVLIAHRGGITQRYFIFTKALRDAPILFQRFVVRRKGSSSYDFLLTPCAENKIGSIASEINIRRGVIQARRWHQNCMLSL